MGFVEGAILGYKRGQRNQTEEVSLIKIKNVDNKADAEFYCGKKIAFVTQERNSVCNGEKSVVPMEPMVLSGADSSAIFLLKLWADGFESCCTLLTSKLAY